MDILTTLNGYVNTKAVILAVFLTQLVKYILPSPTPLRTTEVIPGALTTRLLPLVPLLFGMGICWILEGTGGYSVDDAVKGIMSGMMATYIYRTTKVTFLGE